MLIFALMGAALGMLIAWQYIAVGSAVGLILLVLTPVLFFLQVAVHELGHVVAALAGGLRIIQVGIGRVTLVRAGRSFRLQNRSGVRALGHVVAVPLTERGMRWRMGLFITGGPLASLLVGFLCLRLAACYNESPSNHFPYSKTAPGKAFFAPRSLATGCLNVAGLLGLLMACISLVPTRSAGIGSDAYRLFALLASRPGAKRDILLAILYGTMLNGTRPRDWEPIIVERLLAAREGTQEDASSNLYAYYHALDSGRVEEGGQFLDLALAQRDGFPVASREALFLEGAYFEARHRRNVAAARAWLKQSKPGVSEAQTWHRAEAAVLWADGHHADAAALAETGLQAIPHSRDLGGRLAEKEWLEDLVDACQKGMAQNRSS
jgi:hypothetical protein